MTYNSPFTIMKYLLYLVVCYSPATHYLVFMTGYIIYYLVSIIIK